MKIIKDRPALQKREPMPTPPDINPNPVFLSNNENNENQETLEKKADDDKLSSSTTLSSGTG